MLIVLYWCRQFVLSKLGFALYYLLFAMISYSDVEVNYFLCFSERLAVEEELLTTYPVICSCLPHSAF